MRVSAVQLKVDDADPPAVRVDAAITAVRAEARRGAEVVLLPEMWLSGYFGFDRYGDLADDLLGSTSGVFSQLSRETGVHLCAGSWAERSDDRLYNTTRLFGPDGDLLAAYRKIHLFGYGSRERDVITPGAEVVTCDIAGVRIGLSTCYDLRFPELYRRMVDDRTEVFLVVAGWPFPRLDAWRCLARARAIENQAALVGCNASGRQGGSVFAGASTAFDPWGSCLGELGDRPGVLRCEIDIEAVRAARSDFPALADRVMG